MNKFIARKLPLAAYVMYLSTGAALAGEIEEIINALMVAENAERLKAESV